MGASPIIAPPQSALSPAAKRIRRPDINRSQESRKSPQILQILLQTICPFPAAKRIRSTTINRSPAILKIPKYPENPASDNVHPKFWDAPLLSSQLGFLSLI